jgi:hypothetical protein
MQNSGSHGGENEDDNLEVAPCSLVEVYQRSVVLTNSVTRALRGDCGMDVERLVCSP